MSGSGKKSRKQKRKTVVNKAAASSMRQGGQDQNTSNNSETEAGNKNPPPPKLINRPGFLGLAMAILSALAGFLYSISHIAAIWTLFLFLGSCAQLLRVELRSHGISQRAANVSGGILVFISMIGCSWIQEIDNKNNPKLTTEQQVERNSQLARARQWEPPELPKDAPWGGNNLYPTIKFGGATSTWEALAEPSNSRVPPPFLLPGGQVVTPYTKNNRLYIKAQTPTGDSISDVKLNNEWPTQIPDNWDRNFNSNSFEIVDDKRLPVFQIRYNSAYNVEIYGIFVAPNGAVTIAFGNSTESIPAPVVKILMPKKISGRKAWFKYPSKVHLGELVDK
jgi:hypothetical protein